MSPTLNIVLVAYPGAQQAALAGLTDLFTVADELGQRHEHTPRLRMTAQERFDTPADPAPAAVILPPTLSAPPEPDSVPGLRDWLRTCHGNGAILASVCGGVFLLAATGLLDGRPATAHWRSMERLRAAYPAIRVDPDRLLVDDGDILTAAGVMSWPDLGLRLIEKLLGPSIMMETARFLLIDPPRQDQRQYRSFSPVLTHGDRAILRTQHWLRAVEARAATVADMARISGLEERTFLRRFHKATGLTPLEYSQHLRIEKGRSLLETGALALERIAWEAGYQDAGAFRKIFLRLTGLSPAEYRRRFGTKGCQSPSPAKSG